MWELTKADRRAARSGQVPFASLSLAEGTLYAFAVACQSSRSWPMGSSLANWPGVLEDRCDDAWPVPQRQV